MGIYKSMAGLVIAELTSADIGACLRTVNQHGIPLFDMEPKSDLTVRFALYRSDCAALRRIAEKRGETLKILGRRGLYWDAKGLLRRPVLLIGVLLMLFLVLFVPGRVLFVEVEGNNTIPDKLILETAAENGIGFGASRRAVRSEKMKNALLSALPELQWAGVNTYGCRAVITVRERSVSTDMDSDRSVSSIVAALDGYILSCTVTKGNGLCTVGQAVRAGEVLISGYTDCGLSIEATRAEGEIMAQTRRGLTAVTPASRLSRGQNQGSVTKYSVIIGKKRINFYKGSGISDASCVKMYAEYVLTLPGGFQLPATLVKETVITYDCTGTEVSQADASALLTNFAMSYLQRQMIAGSITSRSEEIFAGNGLWCLTGEYACVEMIGRRQQEQIGEYHEAD